MSADYSLSTKVMEDHLLYHRPLCIYCGVKNLKDKENPVPMGTFIFWAVLGVVLALGRWLPLVSGILVAVMRTAILKKVKGAVSAATKAETEATYEDRHEDLFSFLPSIGMPARPRAITGLGIGLSALNGVALGVRGDHHPADDHEPRQQALHLPDDFERMLSTVVPGPCCPCCWPAL